MRLLSLLLLLLSLGVSAHATTLINTVDDLCTLLKGQTGTAKFSPTFVWDGAEHTSKGFKGADCEDVFLDFSSATGKGDLEVGDGDRISTLFTKVTITPENLIYPQYLNYIGRGSDGLHVYFSETLLDSQGEQKQYTDFNFTVPYAS